MEDRAWKITHRSSLVEAPSLKLAYRADIDGLRAVAVALVVAFHFGLPGVDGGYIGVDLFFVISGFLIASIIDRQPDLGGRWLLGFYGRRVLRLLPAFVVVAAVTVGVATVLMLPDDYEALLRSIRQSLVFDANGYFERETTGYFAANAHELPWLHTWSLSIEWQFYLVFPFVMLALRRLPTTRSRRIALLVLVAAGAIGSIAMVAASPQHAYFSAVARGFEFLVGALAATIDAARLAAARRRVLAWLSVVALAGAATLFTAATPFPGLAALAVCAIGGVLLVVGRSSPFDTAWLAWIGRRSYSIYLWHWPVVAFLAYVQRPPSGVEGFGWVALIVVLSDLTFRWVERPCIAFKWRPSATIAVWAVAPFVIVASLYLVVRNHAGLPGRLGPEAERVEANLRRFDFRDASRCHDYRASDLEPCAFGDLRSTTSALMIGDSHARHLRPFVQGLAAEAHVKVYGLTESQCFALEGAGSPNRGLDPGCKAGIARDFAAIRSGRYRYVMLAERWIGYDRSSWALLDHTVATIVAAGAIPVVFGSTAEDGSDPQACFYRHIKIRRPFVEDCSIALDNAFAQPAMADALATIEGLRRRYPTLIVIDPAAAQCRDGRCATVIDGTPIYVDYHHLNAYGSAMLGAAYRERFGNPLIP
jgi:peptidoglycan/LPS O-acetylase OafA/YrhL